MSKVPQVVLLPFVGYVIDDKGLSYSLVMIFICLSVAGGILLGSYYRGKQRDLPNLMAKPVDKVRRIRYNFYGIFG